MLADFFWTSALHSRSALQTGFLICVSKSSFAVPAKLNIDPIYFLHFQQSLSFLMASHSPGECGHENFFNLKTIRWADGRQLWARYLDLWIFLPPVYSNLAGEQEKPLLKFMPGHSKHVAGRRERQPLRHQTWGEQHFLFLSLLHGWMEKGLRT